MTTAPTGQYPSWTPPQAIPTNGMATAARALGIVSIIANVFAVPSILALIFGIIGRGRANRLGGIGAGAALFGIISGAIMTAIWGVVMIVIIGGALAASAPSFDAAQTDAQIKADAMKQGTELQSVQCPDNPSMTEGSSFNCLVITKDGSREFARVHVDDANGAFTWEIKPNE